MNETEGKNDINIFHMSSTTNLGGCYGISGLWSIIRIPYMYSHGIETIFEIDFKNFLNK